MLIVRIELWPLGVEEQAREIGRIEIANDATGTRELGNYTVALLHAGKFWGKPGAWKTGKVRNYLRTLSPYHLVLAALEATIGRPGLSHGPAPKPVSEKRTTPCNGCAAPIVFTTTLNGKKMPLDADPLKVVLGGGGPLRVVLDDGSVVAARLAEEGEAAVEARTSHFASCPQRDRFRKGD